MAQQAAAAQYNFTPPPHELGYYDGLFSQADRANAGYLGGKEAVEFLALSKLPMDLLKTIWNLVDQNPKTNALDKPKFYVAVRMIQLFQNGQTPADAALALRDGVQVRPPFFEGVNVQQAPQQHAPPPQPQQPQQQPGATYHQPPQQQQIPQQYQQQVMQQHPQQQLQHPPSPSSSSQPQQTMAPQQPPMQPQPQQNSTTTALVAPDPYEMLPHEQSRYEALFLQYAQQDGYVYGAEAVELFSKSGMDRNILSDVWNMSDGDPVDNRLDQVEFAIAMHLIVCVTKKNLPMPSAEVGSTGLPPSLDRIRKESRAAPTGGGTQRPQQGMQGQQQMQQQAEAAPHITAPHEMSGIQEQQQMQSQLPPRDISQQGAMEAAGGELPPPPGVFGGGAAAISDAFEGLSPDPVSADDYSTIVGGMSDLGGYGGANAVERGGLGGGGMGGGGIGGMMPPESQQQHPNVAHIETQPPSQIGFHTAGATPEVGVTAVAPASFSLMPDPRSAPSIPVQLPLESARHGLATTPTPEAPKLQPRPQTESVHHPSTLASYAATSAVSSAGDCSKVGIELEQLRSAHQTLQAEAISLRAKLGFLSEEEQEAQSEITKTATEIVALSTELSGLRTQVMEAKVRLAEAVGTLKAHKDKKETLNDAIQDTRGVYDAFTSAHEALEENVSSDEHGTFAATVAAPQPVETSDLFSWDNSPSAFAPSVRTPTASAEEIKATTGTAPTWNSDDVSSDAVAHAPTTTFNALTIDPSASSISEHTNMQTVISPTEFHQVNDVSNHAPNMYGLGAPDVNGGFNDQNSQVGHQQQPTINTAPSIDLHAAPTGGAVPAPSPMGDFLGGPSSSLTPMSSKHASSNTITSFPSVQSAPPSLTPQQGPPPVQQHASHTAKEVESLKADALKAEKKSRSSEDLERTLSREVDKLKTKAKKAEAESKDLEAAAKKKKGALRGNKKAKQNHERAAEYASAQRKKASDAQKHLDAAQKEAALAREGAEKLRQQVEEAEIEVATAASYMSVNASEQQSAAPSGNSSSYADPFGGTSYQNDAANTSDPYGMGLMGGMGGGTPNQGSYQNPFTMG